MPLIPYALTRPFLFGLDPEQAHELLEASLGAEVVAAETESAQKLAERCLWNPLALEIAARRIRQMQGFHQPIQKYLVKLQASLSELNMPDDPRLKMEKAGFKTYTQEVQLKEGKTVADVASGRTAVTAGIDWASTDHAVCLVDADGHHARATLAHPHQPAEQAEQQIEGRRVLGVQLQAVALEAERLL